VLVAMHQAGQVCSRILEHQPEIFKIQSMVIEFHRELDARGLNCPLPILKTKKALADMISGQVLRVTATDTGSVRDFQAFAKQTGNDLLSQSQENQEFIFFMKRK